MGIGYASPHLINRRNLILCSLIQNSRLITMEFLFNYVRRVSLPVQVGAVGLGGDNPIRLQSMTNTDTMDTQACIEQTKRIVDAGGEIVRLTTQGLREAKNLKEINIGLRREGINTPLVADVHFNANVADVAALYAEKVRINPGNYVDPARKFKQIDYTEEEYAEELTKIEERLGSFLDICKENHTAIRIGVNHGSLSDRIMSRYGNTPAGIVESCMEFLRICVKHKFYQVVISVKSSNTVVMVQSVRQLVAQMEKENMTFPLHLGVTEAGEGEDGRIKSAVGIGALLSDGIGDTIRVSLSEAPESEIPVARKLVDYIAQRKGHPYIPATMADSFNYVSPSRRKTHVVGNIGGDKQPVVFSVRVDGNIVVSKQFAPDYLYVGKKLPEVLVAGQQYVVDADVWIEKEGVWPAFNHEQLHLVSGCTASIKFLFVPYMACGDEVMACLKYHSEIVVVSQSHNINRVGEHRALVHQLMRAGLTHPVLFFQHYNEDDKEELMIKSSADTGALMIDGLLDGISIFNNGKIAHEEVDAISFGILQAGRLRVSKVEYISCPGCGRTLYNLEETIAKIKAATKHLTGLKIGIMGCIVNGPGEMADADYGYVGAGRGKISLYKGHNCVKKNIPEESAVDELLAFINKDLK